MARCLIDADILAYQCAYNGQYKDETTGEVVIKNFSDVEESLHYKLKEIFEECNSDEPPLMFLTGDEHLAKILNRKCRWEEPSSLSFKPSFRYAEAKTKPYKGQRKADKPYHYHNIRAYMLSEYEVVVSDGLEADDMLAIHLTQTPSNILCSVDKDLLQVPGKHYSWSLGKRESMPVTVVDNLGSMWLDGNKVRATGMKQFFSQVLMGDAVDNIRGIEGFGPKAAYKVLNDCQTEQELFSVTAQQYRDHYNDDWEKLLREHIDLTYIIRSLDEDGNPVKYQYPKGCDLLLGQRET